MKVGIVGHEAAKFTPAGEAEARRVIRDLLAPPETVLVSGHCHLGGIDIWAEEEAAALGFGPDRLRIFKPRVLRWSGSIKEPGFRERNVAIAAASDIVHCLVVTRVPDTYQGMRFKSCYHCGSTSHVKSGGCWTANRCHFAKWHLIHQ